MACCRRASPARGWSSAGRADALVEPREGAPVSLVLGLQEDRHPEVPHGGGPVAEPSPREAEPEVRVVGEGIGGDHELEPFGRGGMLPLVEVRPAEGLED